MKFIGSILVLSLLMPITLQNRAKRQYYGWYGSQGYADQYVQPQPQPQEQFQYQTYPKLDCWGRVVGWTQDYVDVYRPNCNQEYRNGYYNQYVSQRTSYWPNPSPRQPTDSYVIPPQVYPAIPRLSAYVRPPTVIERPSGRVISSTFSPDHVAELPTRKDLIPQTTSTAKTTIFVSTTTTTSTTTNQPITTPIITQKEIEEQMKTASFRKVPVSSSEIVTATQSTVDVHPSSSTDESSEHNHVVHESEEDSLEKSEEDESHEKTVDAVTEEVKTSTTSTTTTIPTTTTIVTTTVPSTTTTSEPSTSTTSEPSTTTTSEPSTTQTTTEKPTTTQPSLTTTTSTVFLKPENSPTATIQEITNAPTTAAPEEIDNLEGSGLLAKAINETLEGRLKENIGFRAPPLPKQINGVEITKWSD